MDEQAVVPPLMGNYNRAGIVLERGRGSEVFDDQGRRYLDLLGGLSVTCLGHCPPAVVRALKEQAGRLWHVSNLYRIAAQERLAARLVEASFADQAFFCNSGTEAIEASLKLARLAAHKAGQERPAFVAMRNSFHGRTLGSLSVTCQEAYQAPFRPLLPEVRVAEFGSVEGLRAVMDARVAAVILEPMQAEGGLNLPPEGYLQAVRKLCDEHGAALVFDEVQVGMGRLGTLFAYQKFGVEPDLIALAKGLAAGFPIGAMLARHSYSRHLVPGTHASTFGGQPLACAAALAVLDIVADGAFLAKAGRSATRLSTALARIRAERPAALECRGTGMLQGLRFDRPVAPLVERLREKGVLAGSAGKDVLRLAPALNIPGKLLDEGLGILETTVKEVMP